MKIREIEMFIHPEQVLSLDNGETRSVRAYTTKGSVDYLKCKLSIELPEKSVTITEGQFFEMTKDFMVHAEVKNGPLPGSYQDPLVKWARKLFGEKS